MADLTAPMRWERPNALSFTIGVVVFAFVIWSFSSVGLSLERIVRGIPALGSMLERMFPPDIERLPRILE
jgi:phosphonate transport system permease protein